MAAENTLLEKGDIVAVWGVRTRSAVCESELMDARCRARVIAIDTVPKRLAMARKHGRAETIDFDKHTYRYMKNLPGRIETGEIDPSFVITHVRPLEDAPEMYKTFRDKKDGCIKVVPKPN